MPIFPIVYNRGKWKKWEENDHKIPQKWSKWPKNCTKHVFQWFLSNSKIILKNVQNWPFYARKTAFFRVFASRFLMRERSWKVYSSPARLSNWLDFWYICSHIYLQQFYGLDLANFHFWLWYGVICGSRGSFFTKNHKKSLGERGGSGHFFGLKMKFVSKDSPAFLEHTACYRIEKY